MIDIGFGRVTLVKPFMSITAGSPLITEVKPYLRPLEDMTEEELKEFYIIEYSCEHPMVWKKPQYNWRFTVNGIDWLNKHHFDYRGLIPKELAIKVTEENDPYNIK